MTDPLDVTCPTCHALPGSRCYAVVLATSKTIGLDDPHPARVTAPEPTGDLRLTSPSGVCAVCARPVTGSRRLCGACAVRRAS